MPLPLMTVLQFLGIAALWAAASVVVLQRGGPAAVFQGLLAAGVLTGFLVYNRSHEVHEAAPRLPRAARRRLVQALYEGRVPADRTLDQPLSAVVGVRRARLDRDAGAGAAGLGLLAAAAVVLAVASGLQDQPERVRAFVLLAVALVVALVARPRLRAAERRRLDGLSAELTRRRGRQAR